MEKEQHIIWYEVSKMLPAIGRKVIVKKDKEIGTGYIECYRGGRIEDTKAIYPIWRVTNSLFNLTHWADILDK